MTIANYNIPTELQNNKFIISLYEQSQSKKLSEKQINVLEDILDIEVPLKEAKIEKVDLYSKAWFKTDHHGDYLQKSELVCDVPEEDKDNQITDEHAAQYGYSKLVPEYEYLRTIEMPCNKDVRHNIIRYCYEDFKKLEAKIKRNRFRKTKTRNQAIRIMNKIIDGSFTFDNIEDIRTAVGSNYRHWA